MGFLAGLYTLLLVAICLLQALLLYRTGKPAARQDDEALKEWLRQQLEAQARVLEEKQAQQAQQNLTAMAHISDTLQTAVQGMSSTLTAGQNTQQQTMEQRLQGLEASNARKLEEMRKALADGLAAMQAQNAQKLDEIRHTVDEQLQDALQKRVTESFKAVNDQLEQVYKGLGEMQSLAADVGGLKQVLSGVKTRGILGEIQLGAILEEILAPEQYATEIPTLPNSRNHVEFAVRMPADGEQPVWLPIDSKFPGDTYAALQDAREQGDPAQVEAARQKLLSVVRSCAKDIRDKYVQPPYTTNFGILFLPFEGLYAEVVNSGLVEQLQREYSISVAGPSTMAAILNALQMGFRTLAIQKHSHEAWVVLGAVRSEFEKFAGTIEKAQKSLQGAEQQLELLAGTRTRAIVRQLREVERLQPEELHRESE